MDAVVNRLPGLRADLGPMGAARLERTGAVTRRARSEEPQCSPPGDSPSEPTPRSCAATGRHPRRVRRSGRGPPRLEPHRARRRSRARWRGPGWAGTHRPAAEGPDRHQRAWGPFLALGAAAAALDGLLAAPYRRAHPHRTLLLLLARCHHARPSSTCGWASTSPYARRRLAGGPCPEADAVTGEFTGPRRVESRDELEVVES